MGMQHDTSCKQLSDIELLQSSSFIKAYSTCPCIKRSKGGRAGSTLSGRAIGLSTSSSMYHVTRFRESEDTWHESWFETFRI